MPCICSRSSVARSAERLIPPNSPTASIEFRTGFNSEEKRRTIESIVEKIVLSGGEIDITFCYAPSYEELTKRQRSQCESAVFIDPDDGRPIFFD